MKMPWELAEQWKPGDPPIGVHYRRMAALGKFSRYASKQCPYCGDFMNGIDNDAKAPSRDHKIPLSRGGNNSQANIEIICRECNSDKGSLTHDEYIAVRTGLASRLDLEWNLRRAIENDPRQNPKRDICAGFTRPECLPCPLTDGIKDTTYDSAGEIFTANLCALCRSRLLRGEPQAWAA